MAARSVPEGQSALFPPLPVHARTGQDLAVYPSAGPGTAADAPAPGLGTSDPAGAEVDIYAVGLPAEPWSYVLDDGGIRYRRGPSGWWPFAYADEAREQSARSYWSARADCGVACLRLAPASEYRSWRNEYVLAEPDRKMPHLASARLALLVRGQGLGGVVVPCHMQLDLRAQAFTIDGAGRGWPPPLTAQARMRAAKLLAYVAAALAERDAPGGLELPLTARAVECDRHGRARSATARAVPR